MQITELKYFKNRKAWRAWLAKNHAKKKELWLLYYKKHTGKQTMTFADGAEEALCYGWIDTTLKRIDAKKHALRYTPRRKGSIWSDINKDRVKKLIKAGKMTKAGLDAVKGVDLNSREVKLSQVHLAMPPDFKKLLGKNKNARLNFEKMAPSYKKMYLWWITSAKQEETRKRRVINAVKSVARNQRFPTAGT